MPNSTLNTIDHGNAHCWDQVSGDYARYRDIYPEDLYERLHALGIGLNGQTIIDLGTGSGVIPRYLGRYGAQFIGVDCSFGQIKQAIALSPKDVSCAWMVGLAECIGLQDAIADVVLACMSFLYFDKARTLPEIIRFLKPDGMFVKVSMIWLPFEDPIAEKTEEMVLKYNPDWTGAHFKRRKLQVADWSKELFEPRILLTYDARINFTRDTWRGRIRTCRGMGASSISHDAKQQFEREFKEYLETNVPETFTILHQVCIEAYRPVCSCS